jgi:PAS domain-containing protein
MTVELWQLLVSNAVTLIGGGIGGQYLKGRQDQKQSELQTSFNVLEKQIERLEARIVSLELQNDKLRIREDQKDKDIIVLQAMVLNLNNQWNDFPLPVWFKDLQGRMRYFNKSYEDTFIRPFKKNPLDYIGKTDAEFWGSEAGDPFREHDYRSKTSGLNYWLGIEEVPMNEGTVLWDVLKYTEQKSGITVGFRGVAIGRVDRRQQPK